MGRAVISHINKVFAWGMLEPMDEASSQNHLDTRRIGRLAAARRSAYRSRSYCLIGAGGCFVGAGELVYLALDAGILRRIGYIAGAIVLVWLGWRLVRMSMAFFHEAKKSEPAEPDGPPDFSKLSDGSQLAQNLENLTHEENEQ
jgi:hypothetical protein